ncbi:MAG TPA: glycosyltransferase [Acidimicrobiales bacterium]|jgi:glycosyltransferase involved in cell wall biosynthesis|nr:glycosyltransferase [Acidimicrobiales bacterium]
MSQSEGQPKLSCLASYPDVEVTALVPDRMCFYGEWTTAEPSTDPRFAYVVGRVRAQWILHQWYLTFYPRDLGHLLRQVKPDVVDLWHEPWSLVSAQAVWLTRRLVPSAKIVVETEQNLFRRLPQPFRRFQHYVLSQADAVLARSGGAAEVVRRKGFQGPVRVIGNGVDLALFRPSDRRIARQQLALDGFLVGFVGRLVEEKGLFDLVDAVAACPPDVQLAVVGAGPAEQAIRSRATKAGLGTRLHMLGRRPRSDLPGFLNAVDVLALPSHTTPTWMEQFGRVIVEAHACATPVIGSDSGAIPEVTGSGGVIVPERNAAGLAVAIRGLRDDPEAARRLGQIGRQQVTRWSWPQVADETRSLYLEVTGAAPETNVSPPEGAER